MKIYRLTKEGKKFVRIPNQKREEVLDFLYENSTATQDELLSVDSSAREKLKIFEHKLGYVEEINAT